MSHAAPCPSGFQDMAAVVEAQGLSQQLRRRLASAVLFWPWTIQRITSREADAYRTVGGSPWRAPSQFQRSPARSSP